MTFVKDTSGTPGKMWRNAVADVAVQAQNGEPLLDGPLYVEMTFVVARTQGHFRTGRHLGEVKASAPAYPAVRPDVLKLARAVEDSLTNTLWHDDSRIVNGSNEKVYAEPGEPIGVEVRVWRLPTTVGELAEQMGEAPVAVDAPQAALELYT
jgi:Holliday junction resolvase RusA-like endonuclease